jgi:PAS domain S-box-containing protein
MIPNPSPAELSSGRADPLPSENALSISEATFFFERSLDLLAVIGLDGYFKRVNAQFTQVLGYSEAELLTIPFIEFVHPADRPATLAELAHLKAGAPTLYFENRYITKDQTERWLSWTASPQLQRNVIYGIARDITQQKKTEADLQVSEERWQLALRGSNDGIWDWNVLTHEVFFSTRWKTMLGYTEAEIGNHLDEWKQRVHPEDLESVMQLLKAHFDQKTSFYVSEHRLRCKDGSYKWILDRGQALWDETGQVQRMVGSHTDITERRELAAALQQANQELEQRVAERTAQLEQVNMALQESENRNQLAMEVARMFTFEWEPTTDAVKRSSQCCAILGLTAATAEQDTGANFFHRIHPEDRERFIQQVQDLTPERSTYQTTYRLVRPDGQIVILEESGQALFDDQHQLIRLIGITADVSERQRLERELEASRTILQHQLAEIETIYQSAPIGLNVLDTDLRFRRINQQLAEMNGLTIEQHLGRTVREVLPNLAEAAEQLLRPILETGEPLLNVEIRGETPAKPGVQRVWLESFLPLKDGDRVIGINTVCEEITDRKQAEQHLRESEEQLRLGMQVAGFALAKIDYATNRVELSPEAAGLYGLPTDALIVPRETIHATFHPDDRDELLNLIQQVLDPSSPGWFAQDHRVVWRNGEVKWLTVRKQVFFDRSGQWAQPTYGILVALDITDRKQAEADLRQSEERYRMLFETMEDGFCIIKMLFDSQDRPIDYQFLEVNPVFEQQTGLKQAVGKTARQLVPNLEDFWFEAYGRVALTGESVRFENGSEVMNRWFEVYAFPVGSRADHKVAILFKEISDRKAIEAQREKLLQQEQAAREAAERANQIKDEFLAVLSHELRTPLNPILGWSKLLQSPQISTEKLQQGLTTIERNAKQQVQLIDDLLDISRIIRGKIALKFTPVTLSEPILAALETVRLAAEVKAIQVEVSLDSTVGQVRGDAGRLQQVIWNLLSNAIKFTPAGGRVSVHLRQINFELERPGQIGFDEATGLSPQTLSYAQITVIDTGKGIHSDFLPHVFELFRQQDSSTTRSFGGLGLGLAIARQVVEAHGGIITATSPGEGQGSTFTVQLPLIPILISQTEATCPAPTLNLKNLRILVVDDEADSLEFVQVLFEQEGAITQLVSHAPEALQRLSQSPFDLLISDIGMPEMDGYAFLRQVRALPVEHNRNIPAIALTAYAGETNRHRILSSGFQAHLTKPIDPQHLLDTISTLIPPS